MVCCRSINAFFGDAPLPLKLSAISDPDFIRALSGGAWWWVGSGRGAVPSNTAHWYQIGTEGYRLSVPLVCHCRSGRHQEPARAPQAAAAARRGAGSRLDVSSGLAYGGRSANTRFTNSGYSTVGVCLVWWMLETGRSCNTSTLCHG